jgi:exodeoxyribonuclease VII small subunit
MAKKADTSPQQFEEALEKLEKIVRRMEDGELSLEKALESFEEGVQLARYCQTKLDEAQKRVELLLKNDKGEIETQPFIEEG